MTNPSPETERRESGAEGIPHNDPAVRVHRVGTKEWHRAFVERLNRDIERAEAEYETTLAELPQHEWEWPQKRPMPASGVPVLMSWKEQHEAAIRGLERLENGRVK
jgi:hypothetical protein